jgi:hypothetical protein
MRCNNCGFDNPASNAKCEKCNAPLDGSMTGNGQPEPSTANFVSKETVKGCTECGYPLMPDNSTCPNCGKVANGSASKPETHQEPDDILPKTHKLTVMGTVTGRKLVGFLVTYSTDVNGLFFPLYEGRNSVGRDSASDVCLSGDSGVSGKHFSILYRVADKKFKFRDELSTYGTFVNGQLQDEGELANGDVIQAGSTQLIFMVIPQK